MARKKLERPSKPSGLPLWLGTFGDLMSLLLTFFILLLSMATFDKEKIQSAVGSLQGALSVLEHGLETEITPLNPIQATPITHDSNTINAMNIFSSLITEYNEMTRLSNSPGIDLEESQDGFLIRIPDDLLFATGSSTINNQSGKLFLERLAMQIEEFKNTLHLKIIGNTDNIPYKQGLAIDNWDLSNKRALSVADELLRLKIPANIMQVGGNSEFNPIDSNDTKQGRAKNRRVDIYFSVVGDTNGKQEKANEIINKIKK